ncbi:hypothetical protein MPER_06257, partial [Moniliophthora perniciosa FA553]
KSSPPEDPRYAKSYFDLLFVAYHVVFFSFVRQVITINLCRPLAKRFGIRKETKLDRFGEQGYAVVYFLVMGAWGYRIMKQLPTFWYRTEYFWIGDNFLSWSWDSKNLAKITRRLVGSPHCHYLACRFELLGPPYGHWACSVHEYGHSDSFWL